MKNASPSCTAAVLISLLVVFAWIQPAFCATSSDAPPVKPKLVLLLVVDGLSQSELQLHKDDYTGGLGRLFSRGAWFAEATYSHATTVTAVGHATIASGAHPYVHQVIGNDWLDRETGRTVYCVEDPSSKRIDEPTPAASGTSPANLKVSTLGDELRLSNGLQSRVVGVSGKDRGAILLAGHLGQAYFYSSSSGRFVTTDYYRSTYPDWWKEYYQGSPQDHWAGQTWAPLPEVEAKSALENMNVAFQQGYKELGKAFPHTLPGEPLSAFSELLRTPFGDEYTLDFAGKILLGENLGNNPAGVPDALLISLSSHDYISHSYGPFSAEAHDHLMRLDHYLNNFFELVDQQVGLDNVLIALTADHGFGDIPEHSEEIGLTAGRLSMADLTTRLKEFLNRRFGDADYVLGYNSPTFYLNTPMIRAKELEAEEVEEAAAAFLLDYPGIAAVFTRSQLLDGDLPDTPLSKLVSVSWDARLSGDLFVVQAPGWYMLSGSELAATHGSPWMYDRNVPLMISGPGVKNGRYPDNAHVVDLVPTLAYLLAVASPSGSSGKVLDEILLPQ
jgi:predicted AlkP superfamily pyrophosphatase or phosphodiesterase